MDFTPERLETVQQRLFEIDRLTNKYGPSFQNIMSHADQCEKELAALESYADASKLLLEQYHEQANEYRSRAGALSEKRRMDAARLENEICGEFAALAMERMVLKVNLHPRNDVRPDGELAHGYGPDGLDHVEFLIAPNKGEEMRPLARIASGGELSRIMLAIKSLCGGADKGRTLVFDEVDAGIGGRVAEAVGRRLQAISGDNQVLCVTHLPQIAAFARQHYGVSKEMIAGRTETLVTPLDAPQRVLEVARMLGGATITETVRKHAGEMIEQAARQYQPGTRR
jgi:DNA repair protein RecN (Recombination protein N)